MTSGCKLAYQKPKGRVTSRVREAVAVSDRVEMMERERGHLSRGKRGGTVVGDGRGTGLPSADTRPAEKWPGMGRRPRRVMCGLRLMGVTGGPLGESGPDGGVLRGSAPLRGCWPLAQSSEGGHKGGKPKSSASDRLGRESHFLPAQAPRAPVSPAVKWG